MELLTSKILMIIGYIGVTATWTISLTLILFEIDFNKVGSVFLSISAIFAIILIIGVSIGPSQKRAAISRETDIFVDKEKLNSKETSLLYSYLEDIHEGNYTDINEFEEVLEKIKKIENE